jgi:capsular polysaccharide biosynthesis protein
MVEIQEEEIDLREYINVLLKRKGVIILIFLIAVITAALVSYFYLKPVYEASTILMISKPKYQVELEPKIQTQFTPEVSLATYESLIKDREVEEEVIKKLNLDQPPYELTPDSLQGMITIESLKNTNLIKLNLQAGEPKLAKDIANVWAELFIEKNKDLNLQESKEAQGFIEEQLEISKKNLSTIEEEIREFNETNKIDAMDGKTYFLV